MIHVKNSIVHYINERALTFSENDLSDPQRVAVSLVSGTVVMAHVAGTIDYAADGNYERWTLRGYSTKLINNARHYVYARLSRTERTALIVFSVNAYNIDGSITTVVGKDENGEDVTETTDPSADYFYIRIGELSATDGSSYRELVYDSGLLGTKKGEYLGDFNEMWELDKGSTPWLIRAKQWVHSLTVKMESTFLGGLVVKGWLNLTGSILFKSGENAEQKEIADIKRSFDDDVSVPVSDTTLPTTQYVQDKLDERDDRYIRKDMEDETEYKVIFKDGIEMGRFVKGMVGGSGGKLDGDGYGEMNGLTLREFLEVPELRFNRVDVVSGELWNAVAFGLIESVDTAAMTCTLKLEGKERAGLRESDICRGIFADFGNGERYEEVDECGFLHLYGFRTSYFAVEDIIEDADGRFVFKYVLRNSSTPHPCASMKFAVYGNFLDSSRQASAYATRTYKRYLNKVDTWIIDPDKHIYAQYGDLDGLTIGGLQMSGYGSYQSNVYITGGIFEFTPEQKEEMKGEDAYSVTLSEYVGTVRVDGYGNVIGGEYTPVNVITGEENVITGEENVVTGDYLLKTGVYAFRGRTELAYAEVPSEGTFAMSINPVGCTAVVSNGVIYVEQITDTAYSYINITVSCEGMVTFPLTYQIKAQRDGASPVVADIDNEMDSIACDKDGGYLFGLPVSCTVSMWAGTKKLELDSLSVTVGGGNEKLVTYTADKSTGKVTVTSVGQNASRVIPLNLTLTAEHGTMTYTRNLVFTVNKILQGENGVLYRLVPEASSVKVGDDGTMTASTVSCGVTASDGMTVSNLSELPEGLTMEYFVNKKTPQAYEIGTPVTVVKTDESLTFRLYQEGVMIDTETIPVLLDGSSPVIADIDNEMDSIACDKDGGYLYGLPVGCNVSMWVGTSRISLTSLTATAPSGVTVSTDRTAGTVTVTAVTSSAPKTMPVNITLKGKYGGTEYTRQLVFTLAKQMQGENGVLYKLTPSASAVKVDETGTMSATAVSCRVTVCDGKTVRDLDSLPSDGSISMEYSVSGGAFAAYSYGTPVEVEVSDSNVAFRLYAGGELVDVETIPVLVDGSSPVLVDFDNEMHSVACDENGAVVLGLPLSSTVSMFYGSHEMSINSMAVVSKPDGITAAVSGKELEITGIETSVPDISHVTVKVSGTYKDIEYSGEAAITINKIRQGDSAAVVDLAPSASAVKVDAGGKTVPSSVSCKVKLTTGKEGVSEPSGLPAGYTMKRATDETDPVDYTYGTAVGAGGLASGITFYLYYNGKLVDRETVPVVRDGETPVEYRVLTDVSVIKVDNNGQYSATVIYPSVLRTEGSAVEELYYTPAGCSLYCKIDSGTRFEVTSQHYTYGISVSSATETVQFTLYSGSVRVDMLMIPVIMDGAIGETTSIYSLNPSANVIKKGSDGSTEPSVVTATVMQRIGKEVDIIENPSSLGYTVTLYVDGVQKTAFVYGEDFNITSATESVEFRLTKDGLVVDKETLPVLYDGGDGETVLVGDLSNDTISVACDEDGRPTETISSSSPLTTTFRAYYGLEQVSLTSLSVSTATGITASTALSSGLVKITGFTSSAAVSTELTVTAGVSVGGSTRTLTKTLTVNKVIKGQQGNPGDDGQSGTYIEDIFACSATQPSTPTGSYSIPSGWTNSIPDLVTPPSYSHSNSAWTAIGSYTKSAAVSEGSSTSDVVTFSFSEPTWVVFEIKAQCYSLNYGYLGKMDVASGSVDSSYLARVSGNGNSQEVYQLVPAGTHTYCVKYVKGYSYTSNGDYIMYKVYAPGFSWYSRAQATWNGSAWVYGTWSTPKRYSATSGIEELYILSEERTAPSKPASPSFDNYLPTYPYYTDGKYYYAGDRVMYVGVSYECIKTCSSIKPENATYWKETPSWTLNPSEVSSDYPFQYVTRRTKNAGKWGEWSDPVIYTMEGVEGKAGLNGCVTRTWEKWESSRVYRNDSEVEDDSLLEEPSTGIRYLDILVLEDSSMTSGYMAYQCLKTHSNNNPASETFNSSTNVSSSGNWKKLSNQDGLYVNTLIAKNANIKFGSAFRMAVYDDSNAVVGGMQGVTGSTDIGLWYGGPAPGTAPFRVDKSGYLFASNAEISGIINAESGTFNNVNIESGTIGGFSLSDGVLASTGTYTLKMDPVANYPKISIEHAGTTYAAMYMSSVSPVSGQLELLGAMGALTVVNGGYAKLQGANDLRSVTIDGDNLNGEFLTLKRGSYYLSIGIDSNNRVRLSSNCWPYYDDTTTRKSGTLYWDSNNLAQFK